MKTYPEINVLSLADCYEALRMAIRNMDAITPDGQRDLNLRMIALRERIRRLEWTERLTK